MANSVMDFIGVIALMSVIILPEPFVIDMVWSVVVLTMSAYVSH